MKVRSKICGIKYPADLKAISGLNPDYMGFIYYPLSKRCMKDTLSPADLSGIPETIKKVGVFVNSKDGFILDQVVNYGLDAIQLHGDESSADVVGIKDMLPDRIEIIKAFGIDASFDWESLNDYQDCCDVFLFDTKTANYGGSGRRFDPELLSHYNNAKPVMLSGGIGIDDLLQVMSISGLDLWGVDLNSRLEISPGRKDRKKVAAALNIIKHYERRG